MKHFPQTTFRRGYALILVLAVVVLCSIMIIIATGRSALNLRSAHAFSKTSQVRQLSDMALNLVQAQIRDATTINQTLSTPANERDIWASQPGALRTYASNGTLRAIYKLYSAAELQTDNPDLSADVPNYWHTRPVEFTDINEPVAGSHPIIDPAISLPGATGIQAGFGIAGAPLQPASSQNPSPNAAPMPVRWLYVLEDGTLCHIGDSRIDRDSNAIVGRMAFWTDDETAKVNINTAAPVTANAVWDQPRAYSSSESNTFAWAQPSQNEYQRYPGHPAMVSLRSILGSLSGISSETYYGISPRYRWGGSEEGAKRIDATRTPLLTNKEDRAYVTIDELLFDSRAVAPAPPRSFIPARIDQLRFFLTANSRAPELNLFGQPRVTIWPVHLDDLDTRRTPFDRLIAFCSRVGNKDYFFARANPMSTTSDFEDIERNRQLYAYLQSLTDTAVPGFGGPSFATKYGADRDQILTQIFDYIRITNLNETYAGRDANFASYTPDWTAGVMNNVAIDYPLNGPRRGAGLVVPIEIGGTKGMGRFPVLTEIGLFFIVHSEFKPGPPPNRSSPPVNKPSAPDPENPLQLEGMLVMESITPAFGYMPWCGKDIQFEVASSSVRVQVGSKVMDLFPAGVTGIDPRPIYFPPAMQEGATPGGYDGAGYLYGAEGSRVSGNGGDNSAYRFFSPPLTLEPADTRLSILGGELKINIRAAGKIIQSYTVEFPDAPNLDLPKLNPVDYDYPWTILNRPWWQSRFNHPLPRGPGRDDVLQSVELIHGDARLVAGLKDIPATLFQKHEHYGGQSLAHGFRATNNAGPAVHWEGGTNGAYFALPLYSASFPAVGARRPTTAGYTMSSRPKITSRITDLRLKNWSGDFDNAWYRYLDGPFINKADEGMKNVPPSGSVSMIPYESFRWSIADGLFSPLRQVPSAVMFGSLPTGVKAGIPWRTLLFCPNPADPGHKGFESPADHLLLDLFRMPVVEPLAMSGPLSTDGKINMNYAIAPFSYIRRQSSWFALLEPMKLFEVLDTQSAAYKGTGLATNPRKSIDIAQTLLQFQQRFSANEIFRSPSEMCSLFLVPQGATLAGVQDLTTGYWSTRRPTGDNSREKPYAELYPKLTTQSNAYSVHVRVQALPRSEEAPASGDFKPLAEYRGTYLIERFLNPDDPRLVGPGATVDPDEDCLNELFQFRVLQSRQFVP